MYTYSGGWQGPLPFKLVWLTGDVVPTVIPFHQLDCFRWIELREARGHCFIISLVFSSTDFFMFKKKHNNLHPCSQPGNNPSLSPPYQLGQPRIIGLFWQWLPTVLYLIFLTHPRCYADCQWWPSPEFIKPNRHLTRTQLFGVGILS